MPNESKIERAAASLFNDYSAQRAYSLMEQDFAPDSLEEAYAIQESLLELHSESQGPLAGYKVAFTSSAIQQRTGISEPCAGGIMANTIHNSPAVLSATNFIQIGIECEMAIRMGIDLPASKAPFTRESISEAVDAVMASFEVIDRRHANVGGPMNALQAVSTNILNAGAIFGTPIRDWQKIDLAASRCTLVINGEEVGEGQGADVMGHPLEALTWLANMLASQGKGLFEGAVIITGSMIPPFFLNPGDTAIVSMEGLGDVSLKIT